MPKPPQPLTTERLLNLIHSGKLDSILDALREAVHSRERYLRDQKSATNLATLKPGTRVRLSNLKPKYLNGYEGVVADRPARRRGDIAVDLDNAPSNRYGSKMAVPAGCLEPV